MPPIKKPKFDPNKPFTAVQEDGNKPAFDPSKPFEPVEDPQPEPAAPPKPIVPEQRFVDVLKTTPLLDKELNNDAAFSLSSANAGVSASGLTLGGFNQQQKEKLSLSPSYEVERQRKAASVKRDPDSLKDFRLSKTKEIDDNIQELQSKKNELADPAPMSMMLDPKGEAFLTKDNEAQINVQNKIDEIKSYKSDLSKEIEATAKVSVARSFIDSGKGLDYKEIGKKYLDVVGDQNTSISENDKIIKQLSDMSGLSTDDTNSANETLQFIQNNYHKNGAAAVSAYSAALAGEIENSHPNTILALKKLSDERNLATDPVLKSTIQDQINAMSKSDPVVAQYLQYAKDAVTSADEADNSERHYPQVQREKNRRTLNNLYFDMVMKQDSDRFKSLNPTSHARLALGLALGEEPTDKDIEDMSKQSGMPIEEVRNLVNERKTGFFATTSKGVRVSALLPSISTGADEILGQTVMGFRRFFNTDNAAAKNAMLQNKLNATSMTASANSLYDENGASHWNPFSISNMAGRTVGQMAIYAAPTLATGGFAEGLLGINPATGSGTSLAKGIVKGVDMATTHVSGYFSSYDPAYQDIAKYTTDESARRGYANLVAHANAGAEHLMSPADIAKKIGIGNSSAKALRDFFIRNGDKELPVTMIKRLASFGENSGEQILAENTEEQATNVVTNNADEMYMGKVRTGAELYNQFEQTLWSTTIGMLPTAIIGGGASAMQDHSRMNGQSMYAAGLNSEATIAEMNRLKSVGVIPEADFNHKVSIVNTMKNIVAKVEKATYKNGNPLSYDHKVELAAQEYRIANNNKIKEGGTLAGQEKALEADTQEAVAAQEAIINPVNNSQPVEAKVPVVESTLPQVVGKQVQYNGMTGEMKKDGQQYVFEDNQTNREYVIEPDVNYESAPISSLGIREDNHQDIQQKISTGEQLTEDDQRRKAVYESEGYKFTPQKTSVVSVNDDNTVHVRGAEYVNNYSDPLMAIERDGNGNVVSVNLDTPEGEKRNFRGDVANDIAYQLTLKKITSDNGTRQQFEQRLNSDPAIATEVAAAEQPAAAQPAATDNNGTVSEASTGTANADNAGVPTSSEAQPVTMEVGKSVKFDGEERVIQSINEDKGTVSFEDGSLYNLPDVKSAFDYQRNQKSSTEATGASTVASNTADNELQPSSQEALDKAISAIPADAPALRGMTQEQSVRFIAEQAQNVTSTGEEGNVGDAYDSTVRAFGKEAVDAAIEAHPRETLLAQPTQATTTAAPVINSVNPNDIWNNEDAFNAAFDALSPEDQDKFRDHLANGDQDAATAILTGTNKSEASNSGKAPIEDKSTVAATSDGIGVSIENEAGIKSLEGEYRKGTKALAIINSAKNIFKVLKKIIPNAEVHLHRDQASLQSALASLGKIMDSDSAGTYTFGTINGKRVVRIDIDISSGDVGAMAHEATHAILKHLFNGSPKMYAAFKDKVKSLVSKAEEKYLSDFVNRYNDDDDKPEEYLSELSGLLYRKSTSKGILSSVKKVINDIVNKATGKKLYVTEEGDGSVRRFFKSMNDAFTTGEVNANNLIDIASGVYTDLSRPVDGKGLTTKQSLLGDLRDNKRFRFADLKYPDVVFKGIRNESQAKIATNFYNKIVSRFNKDFNRDIKVASTVSKDGKFSVVVEYESGLKPKYFAYPTEKMGEHKITDDINNEVPLTSLRHELLHEMLVHGITDKFEKINSTDNSATADSIDKVQRDRALNYTLEDVFFERVVESVERIPDNVDTFSMDTFGLDVVNRLIDEVGDNASKDDVLSKLDDLNDGSNEWLKSNIKQVLTDTQFEKSSDLNDKAFDIGKKFAQRYNQAKNVVPKDLQQNIFKFTEMFNEEYQGALTRLSKSENQNGLITKQSIAPKSGVFYKPVEQVGILANKYINESGLSSKEPVKITSVDNENAKKIADEYDKMKNDPSNPDVRKSYEAMADETAKQYRMIEPHFDVEIFMGEGEPYANSKEMIDDLGDNNHIFIYSTVSGYGAEGITEAQRQENPLLAETKFKDANGLPLLVNDLFRAVHDIFGHAELGNSFGAIGEENAWANHSRMYSPIARRAMTAETRGQNSWVNFSGANEAAIKKISDGNKLIAEGKAEEGEALKKKGQSEFRFADQKIGLLPEWVSENRSNENKKDAAKPSVSTAEKPVSSEVNRIDIETKSSLLKDALSKYSGLKIVPLDAQGEIQRAERRYINSVKKSVSEFLGVKKKEGVKPTSLLNYAGVKEFSEYIGKPISIGVIEAFNEEVTGIRLPSGSEVILPMGSVEEGMNKLFQRNTSPSAKQLRSIVGLESMPDYETLKNITSRAISQFSDQANWYVRASEVAKDLVGESNLAEFGAMWGITSAQSSVSTNLQKTLWAMINARKFDLSTEDGAAKFDLSFRSVMPTGDKPFSSKAHTKNMVNFYRGNGYTSDSNVKTFVYSKLTVDAGAETFNPFTVMDTHMIRFFSAKNNRESAATDEHISKGLNSANVQRSLMWLTARLSQDLGVRPDQAQAVAWFYAKTMFGGKTDRYSSGTLFDVDELLQNDEGSIDEALNNRKTKPLIEELNKSVSSGRFDKTKPYNDDVTKSVFGYLSSKSNDMYSTYLYTEELEKIASGTYKDGSRVVNKSDIIDVDNSRLDNIVKSDALAKLQKRAFGGEDNSGTNLETKQSITGERRKSTFEERKRNLDLARKTGILTPEKYQQAIDAALRLTGSNKQDVLTPDEQIEYDNIFKNNAKVQSLKDRIDAIVIPDTGDRSRYSAIDTFAEAGFDQKGRPPKGQVTTIPLMVQANVDFINQLLSENPNAIHDIMDHLGFNKNAGKLARDFDLSGISSAGEFRLANVLFGYIHQYPLSETGLSVEQQSRYAKYLKQYSSELGRNIGQSLNLAKIRNVVGQVASDMILEGTLSAREYNSISDAEEELLNIMSGQSSQMTDEELSAAEDDLFETKMEETEREKQAKQSNLLSRLMGIQKRQEKLSSEVSPETSKSIVDKIDDKLKKAKKNIVDILNKLKCD